MNKHKLKEIKTDVIKKNKRRKKCYEKQMKVKLIREKNKKQE